jgi:hypothetical protein
MTSWTSTYQLLLDIKESDLDGKTAPKRKLRRRLYLVCLALNVEPARYGLGADVRNPEWSGDELLTKQLRRGLPDVGERALTCKAA